MQHLEKRPLIGVITAKAAEPEQRQLLGGILTRAHKHGADTVIFSNIYNFDKYYAGTEVENKIYDLILSERIDGLILTAESILNPDLQQYIYERITKRSVPVVVTGAVLPGMCCINTDVTADFEAITRHVTEVHGMTDIDFLTGYEGVETCYERIQGCRNVLAEQGLMLTDEHIIFGDFWMNSGNKLAMDYIEKRRKLPQAILCANDYMAYGIIDTFLDHGIKVPDDVTVIGYEYIGKRFYHAPILTTYRRNRYAMGEKAVEVLLSQMTGRAPEEISLAGDLLCGASCTCRLSQKALSEELKWERVEQQYNTLNMDANFEQQLTVCRSIEDYIHVLQEFVYLIRDCTGLYLCLYEDWCSSGTENNFHAETLRSSMLCYRVMSQQEIQAEPVCFIRDQLFPEKLPGAVTQEILYFQPILFAGREMGYFILQYDEPDGIDPIFRYWLKIAANGLEALRMKNDIRSLLECRDLSEFHDTATGLYTREGFFNEVSMKLDHVTEEGSLLVVLLRVPLFADNASIDKRQYFIRLEAQIAECIKKLTTGEQEFGAKLFDRQFAIACVGCYDNGQEQLLADKLLTLVQHAPLYQERFAQDAAVCVCTRLPAGKADLASDQLKTELETKMQQLSAMRSQPGYPDYAKLRAAMFHEPQREWTAQEMCREFHLSYGHFRATYKELFGVSFHHDLIESRIGLAKYLLLTTSMSLQAISYKCGYEDYKYFLRQFRQMTGKTPNAYRNA